jgi:hypothetical protein
VDYFSSLFAEPPRCPILETLKVIELIPISISEEMNESLRDEVQEGEILAMLEAFQKSNRLGLDGLTVEFFLGFYDLVKEYLLKII